MSKKKVVGFFSLLMLFAMFLVLIQFRHFGGITGFIVFNPLDELNGTFENTTYSNGSIVFVGNNVTGSYLSEIIDAGRIARWNNISWQGDDEAVFFFKTCFTEECSESWNQIFFDGFGNINSENARYAQFKIDVERNSGESFFVSNISIDYDLLDIPPSIDIFSPQSGAIYGYNESVSVEYDLFGENIESCWYDLDGSIAYLFDCENFSLDLSEGEHELQIFVNNSLGLESSEISTFLVAPGFPTVILDFPLDNSSTNQSVLGYYVEDSDLYYCELFADFNGVWDVTNNDSEPESGQINTFSQELDDGNYAWSVVCGDLEDNVANGPNWTFNVDSVAPSVSVSQPVGQYSSKKNIPLVLSVDDENVVSCTYTVRDSSNSVVFSLSLAECQSTTFNVAREGNYVLTISSVDVSGNSATENRQFSVGSSSSSSNTDSGSQQTGVSLNVGNPVPQISYTPLSVVSIKQGSGTKVVLEIINSGNVFLNNCRISGSGEYVEWISNNEVHSLSPGQKASYELNVNVPIDASTGIINLNLFASCIEITSIVPLPVEIKSSAFEFKFLGYERIGDEFRGMYEVRNRLQDEQILKIIYVLENSEGIKFVAGEEDIAVAGDRAEQRQLIFNLPKDSFGEFRLILKIESLSDFYESTQNIILASRGTTGFAISDDNKKTLSFVGMIVIVLAFMLFVMRFLKKHSKKTELPPNGRQFIDLDLGQQQKDTFK